ncbi:MAG: hypothetical protein F6K48_34380 [Okeania sp. SIO3H1]|uniref:hypothetical protein n=1 Tax=Okeania sp. SIO1I7 TaxID=2607772 RepID=UPI0013CB182E|nr:hypothetical protein [Okeania sp. SIO1I7]NEN93688.1 hypothetical protein [Okeania sp. SIO3H1]NET28440.1 hypothetical protein [Okeania sp. SIO1I7]
MLKRVYDINLNYLGVNPPLTKPLTPPRRGARRGTQDSGGKKKEERVVEGESFLFALLSAIRSSPGGDTGHHTSNHQRRKI